MAKWEKESLRASPFRRLMESARWKPLLEMVGLNEVMADRLLRILLAHLMLDRVITENLTLELVASGSKSADLKIIERHIAKMNIARRAGLCVALGVATAAWERDFKAFNAVRNKLSHYNPKFDLSTVKELCSYSAFEACIQRGLRAMNIVGKKSS